MTNYIFLSGVKLKAHIGVTEEERNKLQELKFDVTIELINKNPFEKDDLSATIDYAAIEEIIRLETENSNFKLLESPRGENNYSYQKCISNRANRIKNF